MGRRPALALRGDSACTIRMLHAQVGHRVFFPCSQLQSADCEMNFAERCLIDVDADSSSR